MAIDPKKLAAFAKGDETAKEEDREESAESESEEDEDEDEKDDADYVDEALSEIEETGGDEQILKLVAEYDPTEEGNPPSWVEDEDVWERAKEAVDPDGEGADYGDVWAVVATVYKKMGGEFKGE